MGVSCSSIFLILFVEQKREIGNQLCLLNYHSVLRALGGLLKEFMKEDSARSCAFEWCGENDGSLVVDRRQ